MKVNEVFYSLQGEGYNQGLPTVFIRLQGCNLEPGCTYCDTEYARKDGGRELSVEEIIKEIVRLSPSTGTRVCITGGEPLYQEEELEVLVATLNKFLYYTEVFTNGTLPKPFWWTRVNSWVVDIKTPSSGIKSTHFPEWIESRPTDQIKLTVGNSEDLEFASRIVAACATKPVRVIVSPIANLLVDKKASTITEFWNKEWLQEVAEFCIDKRVRLSLQIHKLIWGNKKGV